MLMQAWRTTAWRRWYGDIGSNRGEVGGRGKRITGGWDLLAEARSEKLTRRSGQRAISEIPRGAVDA